MRAVSKLWLANDSPGRYRGVYEWDGPELAPVFIAGGAAHAYSPATGQGMNAVTSDATGGHRVRLHELLARPGVHVLLERDAELARSPASSLVHVRRLTSTPGRGLLTIRPDGYVGLRCQDADARQLDAWLRLAGRGGATGGCW